jgi:hypothetical protein
MDNLDTMLEEYGIEDPDPEIIDPGLGEAATKDAEIK